MVEIKIKADDKILTVDGEEYLFKDILMSKDSPDWIVNLEDGGVLLLNFGDVPPRNEPVRRNDEKVF